MSLTFFLVNVFQASTRRLREEGLNDFSGRSDVSERSEVGEEEKMRRGESLPHRGPFGAALCASLRPLRLRKK